MRINDLHCVVNDRKTVVLATQSRDTKAVQRALGVQATPTATGRFLGIGRTDHVEVGDESKSAGRLHGLVGRAILPYPDRVVGPYVKDGQTDEGG